jgi:hypothetical protein
MNLNQLQKLLIERRAELVKLENAVEVLSALNGTKKLAVLDRHVTRLSTEPSDVALVPKRRGRPPGKTRRPGYTHSAATRAKLSATMKAKHAAATSTVTIPETLKHWRFSRKFGPSARKKIALAVIHHLTEAGRPTDWPTVEATIKQLGWKQKTFGIPAQLVRWQSAEIVKGRFVLTPKGAERLAEVEAQMMR